MKNLQKFWRRNFYWLWLLWDANFYQLWTIICNSKSQNNYPLALCFARKNNLCGNQGSLTTGRSRRPSCFYSVVAGEKVFQSFTRIALFCVTTRSFYSLTPFTLFSSFNGFEFKFLKRLVPQNAVHLAPDPRLAGLVFPHKRGGGCSHCRCHWIDIPLDMLENNHQCIEGFYWDYSMSVHIFLRSMDGKYRSARDNL